MLFNNTILIHWKLFNGKIFIAGGLASILPEQLGIWSYPYPLRFNNKANPQVLVCDQFKKSMADGEQTIFNMVNGLCGNMLLSRRINHADELNMRLIKDAIILYKAERHFLHNTFPFWPVGFTRINNHNSWDAVGLVSRDNSRAFIAVWRLGSGEEFQEIPVYNFAGKHAVIRQIYPNGEDYKSDYYYNYRNGIITVQLCKQYTAR